MKSRLLTIIALSALVAIPSAMAGKGHPIIAGTWAGYGEAMYVDGTPAIIVSVVAELHQDGNFFFGTAKFDVMIGGDTATQVGQISGYIAGNKLTGVMGGCFTQPPDCVGVGVLDGKLSGNRLTGTMVDLSDGSTAIVTLRRAPN